jgi:hypothetical protein
MASRSYALERGGPKVLRLTWRRGLRDFEVAFGERLLKLDPAAVRAGTSATLPDGSALHVRYARRSFWSIAFRDDLHVERDGVPVPGSDGDPRVIGRRAARVMAFFGLLRVAFLLLFHLFSRQPGTPGPVQVLVLSGLALLVLAVLAAYGLRLAVALGAGLVGLEVVVAVAAGVGATPVALLIQILLVAHLASAWRRMRPRAPRPALGQVFG